MAVFFSSHNVSGENIQAAGLVSRYSEDPDFALELKLLPALVAFVPIFDVVTVFDDFIASSFYTNEAGALQLVVDYFKVVWIGRPNRRGDRRAPVFVHGLWNCLDAILENLPHTNNSVEGWNRRFNDLVGAQHPTIWKFI